MHAFDVLGDPVRRRVLELLADGEHNSGAVVTVIQREFGITQAAVSQHLRVLRECGFATVRVEGARRVYAINADPFAQVDEWLNRFRIFWTRNLDALATEVARGKHQARVAAKTPDAATERLPLTAPKKLRKGGATKLLKTVAKKSPNTVTGKLRPRDRHS